MKSRWTTLAIALAALTTVAACGSTGTTASPVTSTVTVTAVVTPTSSATEAPQTVDPTTTDETATDTAPTIDRGTDGAAYVGRYQRHESLMDLEADQTGTLNEGANAADGENWAITWRPAAQGITITYEQLLKEYGRGLDAGLAPGRTFTARFTTGATGKQILSTSAIPPSIIAVGWCRSGPDGGSPECGA